MNGVKWHFGMKEIAIIFLAGGGWWLVQANAQDIAKLEPTVYENREKVILMEHDIPQIKEDMKEIKTDQKEMSVKQVEMTAAQIDLKYMIQNVLNQLERMNGNEGG